MAFLQKDLHVIPENKTLLNKLRITIVFLFFVFFVKKKKKKSVQHTIKHL